MGIAENIARVRERMAAAARRTGRDPGEISLMAVSKTFSPELARQAYEAGVRLFGENRVQEFTAKVDALRDLAEAEWHMIGHLQANKAAKAVELFGAVDSVDSLRLARRLNASAAEAGKKLPILIEINIGGERAKSGVAPQAGELQEILQAAPSFDSLQINGLMAVPPLFEEAQRARPYFRRLGELRSSIAAQNLPGVKMGALSMGMSHDFEVAVEEGSTCVRVGTAIFGDRM